MTYADLQEAVRVFGLGERATLHEIKARHRELAKRHHPDGADGGDAGMMRQVNDAYRLLLEYLSGYRFSFAQEEFYEQYPEARLWMQFGDDPLWGGRKE